MANIGNKDSLNFSASNIFVTQAQALYDMDVDFVMNTKTTVNKYGKTIHEPIPYDYTSPFSKDLENALNTFRFQKKKSTKKLTYNDFIGKSETKEDEET